MTAEPAAHWYVIHTQTHAEEKSRFHLERQGYQVYLPRYLKRRRHARRVEIVASPFFPRYLFVAVDVASQRWRSVNSTIGVARLVCNGEHPAIVSDRIIGQIRRNEDEKGFVRVDQSPRFSRGDKVRVLDGALSDCFGLFEGATSEERVSILLDLLGRKVRVFLETDSIAAA